MSRRVREVGAVLGVALLASCGALVGDQAAVGGETHFLITCEGGCGPGLSCIAGVCTRGCEPGYSSCSELAAEAACMSVPEAGADASEFRGTCDVSCAGDADCAALGAHHGCRAGMCRAPAAPALASTTGSARQPLVNAVGIDTCRSGLRWAGGDTPSAEMRPGSDCLGCHGDTSAHPLLLAGTVYPSSNAYYRGLAPPPIDDCFGIEGVEVVIRDSVGREFSALTNRAGNFYFEGSASELALPYEADIRWRLDGEEISTQMGTSPRYGGCAHCHGSTEPAPVEFDILPDDAAYVYPVAPVYTPGLYPE